MDEYELCDECAGIYETDELYPLLVHGGKKWVCAKCLERAELRGEYNVMRQENDRPTSYPVCDEEIEE